MFCLHLEFREKERDSLTTIRLTRLRVPLHAATRPQGQQLYLPQELVEENSKPTMEFETVTAEAG